MKVTYNWLKDFVDIKILPKQLADKLTMAGLEVTSLEEKDGDFVFEIEVTSNRPDLLSVIGIAREVAAITNSKFNPAKGGTKFNFKKEVLPLKIEIEDKKDCPLYTAKIIRDVKVGASPDWLRKRLELVGCRSVNNIVDITNYILFELGEPLHAFDLDKLSNHAIIIRRAKNNEKITTIDGEEKILSLEILMIADREKAVAIAGIMGGKDTEVAETTKNILLEAAVFNPITIRRARGRLGLQSESSYRFERGVDFQIVENASRRAVQLIQQICGGRCILAKSSGTPKRKNKWINLEVSSVHKILGVNIRAAKIKKILNSLQFKVKVKTKSSFVVGIPSHRPDINLEIDLIEEVARDFGYEKIPKSLPKVSPQITTTGVESLVSLTKNILVGLGLNEVITYGLIDQDLLSSSVSREDSSAISISNPLSKEQEILRPTLIPSLCRCIAYNLNQKQGLINIFEVSKVFSGSGIDRPKEELVLAIALCGMKSLLLPQGLIKEDLSILHLKGILEVLFERLGIKEYNFATKDNPWGISVYVNKDKIGIMIRLPKEVLEKFDIKNKDVFTLELSLDRLFFYVDLKKKFTSLPIYPSISRDISLILREGVALDDILKAMKDKGRPLLREVKVVDYYKGKQIPAGFCGLTISCLYRSDERTLTEADINPVHSLVSFVLADKFSAQIRKT